MKCRTCNGSGKVICRECGGVGTVPRIDPALMSIHRLPLQTDRTCDRCQGSGKERCSSCLGTGKFANK